MLRKSTILCIVSVVRYNCPHQIYPIWDVLRYGPHCVCYKVREENLERVMLQRPVDEDRGY